MTAVMERSPTNLVRPCTALASWTESVAQLSSEPPSTNKPPHDTAWKGDAAQNPRTNRTSPLVTVTVHTTLLSLAWAASDCSTHRRLVLRVKVPNDRPCLDRTVAAGPSFETPSPSMELDGACDGHPERLLADCGCSSMLIVAVWVKKCPFVQIPSVAQR